MRSEYQFKAGQGGTVTTSYLLKNLVAISAAGRGLENK
jgi:hypothetical protein